VSSFVPRFRHGDSKSFPSGRCIENVVPCNPCILSASGLNISSSSCNTVGFREIAMPLPCYYATGPIFRPGKCCNYHLSMQWLANSQCRPLCRQGKRTSGQRAGSACEDYGYHTEGGTGIALREPWSARMLLWWTPRIREPLCGQGKHTSGQRGTVRCSGGREMLLCGSTVVEHQPETHSIRIRWNAK
jgi:hypothetical protein